MYGYLVLPFILLMAIHIQVVANTDYTDSSKLTQLAISLLSPVVAGYLVKKWLNFFHHEREDRSSAGETTTASVEHTGEGSEPHPPPDDNQEQRIEEEDPIQLLRRRQRDHRPDNGD